MLRAPTPVPTSAVPSETAPPARHRPAEHRRENSILVVEDDLEMRRMVSDALRREGYTVFEAANGDEALEWLGPGVMERPQWLPALVVSDIRLPYFSGLEILEGLHVLRHRVPVILITAFPDDEVRATARELGAACVLAKPFELDELRAAVRQALRGPGTTSTPI